MTNICIALFDVSNKAFNREGERKAMNKNEIYDGVALMIQLK